MSGPALLFLLLSLLLAPLLLGVINRTKAIFAGRTGAPVFQTYIDLWKLMRKGAVYSTTTTWVFRAGPMVGLATAGFALALVPVGRQPAPLSFSGDIFLFAGLLALGRFMTIVAAMDTGSAFEGMGASREATFAALAEPGLFLCLSALALTTNSISLSSILGTIGWGSWSGLVAPSLAMCASAVFLLLLVENARVPVDDPNTHLELTMIHEVMVLDHSGPDLGFITYASALKMWLFAALIVGILIPFHLASAWLFGLVFLGGIFALGVFVGIVESVMARLRMLQVPHLLIGCGVLGALGVALAAAAR